MQLKFSKKSFIRETHSFLGGSGLKIRRPNRSPNTSGFQYIHLFSSTEALDIISWNEESPVLSATHWIPFGEKMENPEEEPVSDRISITFVFLESGAPYQYIVFHRNCSLLMSTSYQKALLHPLLPASRLPPQLC